MERELIGGLGVVAMIVLMFLRVPIAYALLLVGWIGLSALVHVGAADGVMAADPYSMLRNFDLTTIPSFMLMGYIAYVAGFTKDIYETARIWFARTAGGLAAASTLGCAAFAAVSGSSVATAAAMGKIAVPEMLRRGYDKGLATGVVAASGTLGSLIPPSVLMILYAVFTDQSIAVLFIAALIPGILSALLYVAMILVRARINPALGPGMAERTSWGEKFSSLKGTWSILLLFVVVMGGILVGVFTPMESGAMGAAGAFIIALVSGRLTRERLRIAFLDTLRQTAIIFAIVFGALVFTRFIALSGLGQAMAEAAVSISSNPLPMIVALSVIYVVLGTFMGPIEIMLLTLPLVTPIIDGYGLSLVWFAVIMIKFLEIGLITPPLGFNVFVIASVVGKHVVPITSIFRGVIWFIAIDVLTLAILIAFPSISLYLPEIYLDWTAFLRTNNLGVGSAIWLWLTGGLPG